jgi:zinc transport system substrate-binding protein
MLSALVIGIILPSICPTLSGQNEIDANLNISLVGSSLDTSTENQSSAHSIKLKIISSFYPIHAFVNKVGGDKIDSSILVPPETEPHDFEPTINQIQEADSADALIYNWLGIENWIGKIDNRHKIDSSAQIRFLYTDNSNKTADPHVWLDPVLAKSQVENIRDGLITIDPNNRDNYIHNAQLFLSELDALDKKIRDELRSCQKRDFVAFHSAFSYFADRYGLKQHSISTAGPEEEIKPQRLAEVISIAKNFDLRVIYSEELIDPRYAAAITQDIPNGKVLILSPIEGVSREEQVTGAGYIDKMEQNLQNLKIGLQCG